MSGLRSNLLPNLPGSRSDTFCLRSQALTIQPPCLEDSETKSQLCKRMHACTSPLRVVSGVETTKRQGPCGTWRASSDCVGLVVGLPHAAGGQAVAIATTRIGSFSTGAFFGREISAAIRALAGTSIKR